jgi:hypothetical protein
VSCSTVNGASSGYKVLADFVMRGLVRTVYRGSEPSIMQRLFSQDKEGRRDFPNGVYWCIRHGESPHPNVEALAKRLGSNFQLLRIDGFDETLADLGKQLAGQDRYAAGGAAETVNDILAYDERIVEQATPDDVDFDVALSVLSV